VHAQVIHATPAPGRSAELDRIVGDELISALQEEPGFVGTFDLVDRRRGETMVIVLWHTLDQAFRAPDEVGPRLRAALAAIEAASVRSSRSTSVWEVTARI
jgi:hypothetical protein